MGSILQPVTPVSELSYLAHPNLGSPCSQSLPTGQPEEGKIVTLSPNRPEETQKKAPDIEKLPPRIRRFLEKHPEAYLVEDEAAFVLPQGSPRLGKTEDSELENDE